MIGTQSRIPSHPITARLIRACFVATADRANMLQKFEQTVLKLSLLGFDQSTLTDCSDVIPVATGTVADPFLPAGMTMDDIEASCDSTPFPSLSAVPGPVTSIPAV
ncbi:hypothetical protein C8Q73DRAFT_471167 [Cubamyces lactineus]|nr:hypothetical protein C8Q73DRAFT_471167 [Cubamyces lactineus]